MITYISFQNTTATVKHKGAELFQIEKDNKTYIWEIDENYWNKTSPVLFPIVGSLKNNNYQYQDKIFSMLRHGFVRDYEFELIEKLDNKAVFSLFSNEETHKIYPFEFEFQIIYILNENGLEIKYFVKNLSKDKMPFSLGAHPAFKIDGNFEDYCIEFETNDFLTTYHLENELLTGETSTIELENKQLKLNYKLFERDAIILKNHVTNFVKLLKNNELILKISFKDFPFLGIWTKKDAPFICIEPWFGIADSVFSDGNIFEKEGILILEFEEDFTQSIFIEM
jgi:galactose mutarotase-like enzyme